MPRPLGARPRQVFAACFVLFLLMDVLGEAGNAGFRLSLAVLIGPAITAALFTSIWWFVWGRLRR
jgi:hypothetical protein